MHPIDLLALAGWSGMDNDLLEALYATGRVPSDRAALLGVDHWYTLLDRA